MTEEQKAKMALIAIRAIEDVINRDSDSCRRKTEPIRPIVVEKYDIKAMRELGTTSCGCCGGDLQFLAWANVIDGTISCEAEQHEGVPSIMCPDCGKQDGDYTTLDEFNKYSGGTKWAVKAMK